MDLGIILIVVVLLVMLAIAVVLFVRSPNERKFNWFTPAHKPGVEYAPEYTLKEKFSRLGVHLLWLVPLFWLIDFKLPVLIETFTQDRCVQWLGLSAVKVTMALLVWFPVVLITPVMVILWRHWRRVDDCQQHPLPGQKVYKPTPYIRGQLASKRARLITKIVPFVWIFLLILSAMMHLAMNQLMTRMGDQQACQSISQEQD